VKKCVKISVILFKNWKHVFKFAYQTGPITLWQWAGAKKGNFGEIDGLVLHACIFYSLGGVWYIHLKIYILLFKNMCENTYEW